MKTGLKQGDKDKEITVELDSGETELVISSEYVRENKFKKKKKDQSI